MYLDNGNLAGEFTDSSCTTTFNFVPFYRFMINGKYTIDDCTATSNLSLYTKHYSQFFRIENDLLFNIIRNIFGFRSYNRIKKAILFPMDMETNKDADAVSEDPVQAW